MKLFYVARIRIGVLALNEEESAHATQILRLKVGDTLHLTCGDGFIYEAYVLQIEKRACIVEVTQKLEKDYTQTVCHIAIAPTKNIERFEYFLEKATEIGVASITPILTQRSERTVVKHDRLEKILITAMKQSLSGYLPKLQPLQPLDQFLKNLPNVDQKFMAHCNTNSLPVLKNMYQTLRACVILIGPEGDFSLTEVEKAEAHQFQSVSLGETRLRTETAGVVAVHTIALMNQ